MSNETFYCGCGGDVHLIEIQKGASGAAVLQCRECHRISQARIYRVGEEPYEAVETVPCPTCRGEVELLNLMGVRGYASVLQCRSCSKFINIRFGEISNV